MRFGSPGRACGHISIAVLFAGAALAAFGASASEPPDWNAVKDVEEVEVVSHDADGAVRETTVWLAVVDGQGYLRTGPSTTWGDNVVRDADISLRIAGTEHPLHASLVEDDALRARIFEVFRAKYGFMDKMLDVVRGSRPRVFRLESR